MLWLPFFSQNHPLQKKEEKKRVIRKMTMKWEGMVSWNKHEIVISLYNSLVNWHKC